MHKGLETQGTPQQNFLKLLLALHHKLLFGEAGKPKNAELGAGRRTGEERGEGEVDF